MPKYYVESGNFRIVTHARNARGAAIWAVHRAMGKVMPFLADLESGDQVSPVVLEAAIKTSERGFGRDDAVQHVTFDVLSEWNRLMVALDKLQDDRPSETTAV
jgi:hypothetical protein